MEGRALARFSIRSHCHLPTMQTRHEPGFYGTRRVCLEARFHRERGKLFPPAACPSLSPTPCPCEGCEGGIPGRIKGGKPGKGSRRASYRGGIMREITERMKSEKGSKEIVV